jgi:hypothetical protein
MAIRVSAPKAQQSPKTTLPVTGVWFRSEQGTRCPLLYIQHRTSAAADAKLSYKQIPIVTRPPADGGPGSLFYRLCKVAGVKCNGMTQKAAAQALALAIAEKGAIRCKRVGKEHNWEEIEIVNFDSQLEPWHLPLKDGITWTALLLPPDEEQAAEEEPIDDVDEDTMARFDDLDLEGPAVAAHAYWTMADWSGKLNVDCVVPEGRTDGVVTKLYDHYRGEKLLEPKALIRMLRLIDLNGVAKKFSREAALVLKSLIVAELEKLP